MNSDAVKTCCGFFWILHIPHFCSKSFPIRDEIRRTNGPEKHEALKDGCWSTHRERERERTRWLQVHGSYICALIDVIILVLNNRLRDKPAKGWERERETCSGTQKNMKAHAGTHWSLVETLKNVKQIKYLKLFFQWFYIFLSRCITLIWDNKAFRNVDVSCQTWAGN